ncbi:MAG TPA: hypothetical protein VHO66_06365, partial [Ruminiclostridium sp.]|nr:hypothetical protein [Ruminiclostridium sp.]
GIQVNGWLRLIWNFLKNASKIRLLFIAFFEALSSVSSTLCVALAIWEETELITGESCFISCLLFSAFAL